MAIRFMHTADLHLGSPFLGLGKVEDNIAESLRNATARAFQNIVDECVKRRVDFLLVAGDVYDGADRTLGAQLAFRNALRRLSDAGIRAYVVHGNHDPLDGWSSSLEWPQGVHVFNGDNPEPVHFERDGATHALIHGISFPRRDVKTNLARKFRRHDSSVFQIGLLHCNVGDNTGHDPYAPCSLDDLTAIGLDYWALGHIHAKRTLNGNSPMVVYPGNIQGRHINESGPRGCYFVQVDDTKRVEMEFIVSDAVRWARESIDVSALDSEEKLNVVLEEAVQRIQGFGDGRMSVCRLTLVGRGPLHSTLQRLGYRDELQGSIRSFGTSLLPMVWVDAIETRTRPAVDPVALRQSQDILGDCLRLVDEYLDEPDRRAGLVDRLRELYESQRLRKLLTKPGDEELLSLIRDAEALCIDRLLGDG